MKMIYSILILVAVVLLFFWVVKQHKKAEREYYVNNNVSEVMKKFQNMKATPKEKDTLCALAAGSGKITKKECLDLLEKYGNAEGAIRIFAKAVNVTDILKLFNM
jgi:hypothetical protein